MYPGLYHPSRGASFTPNALVYIYIPVQSLIPSSHSLLRHVLERLRQVLLAERELADGPDLGVLFLVSPHPHNKSPKRCMNIPASGSS